MLHPNPASILALQNAYPNIKWFISLYSIWSYAIFYILSEFWGSVVVSLLFWQFANEITKTSEAKRFYSLFGLLGNIALIASGTTVELFSSIDYPLGMDSWETTLTHMMMLVVMIGVGIMGVYWWMNKYVLPSSLYYSPQKEMETHKDGQKKSSMRESLGCIFSSKYLGCIAVIVISYGIAANLVDVTWKSQIKANFPHSKDYFLFMGRFSYWTGISTIALILFTKGIVRRFGWFTGAIITPIMLLVTSVFFFAFILFKDSLQGFAALLGVTSVYMAMMIGATQNILTKGTKYSLFDPTKEMSYIPLNQELKVKGKAAVDVIGGRAGKSGGGLIQFLLLTMTAGSQATIAPYLLGVIILAILFWMGAVRSLSKRYYALTKE